MRGLSRRLALTGLAAASIRPALAAPAAAGAPAAQMPGLMIVAGQQGGRLDPWADLLSATINAGLPGQSTLERRYIGGADGVTGANQFEARAAMDGSTAMLVPGTAALSWLVGETRARFDPTHWVPVVGGVACVVLVSRIALVPGQTIRLAAPSLTGPEVPVLLALDLMGINAIPNGTMGADAYVLSGTSAVRKMAGTGFQPVMTLGIPGQDGARDPTWPTLPTSFELTRGRGSARLQAALRAAVQAAQLDSTLVLPQLAPPASVALWRTASSPILEDPALVNQTARIGPRPISAASTAEAVQRIVDNPAALIALRHWLAGRYDFTPG